MEFDDRGKLRFTPHEELIIGTAMAAEDSDTRRQEEELVEAIGCALFSRALARSRAEGVEDEEAFGLARKADQWLGEVLDMRWPIRRIDGAERYLDECYSVDNMPLGKRYALKDVDVDEERLKQCMLEEKAKIEAIIERLRSYWKTSEFLEAEAR